MKQPVTIKHYCKECNQSIRDNQENAKPLLEQHVIVDIHDNFTPSELSEVVKADIIKRTCKKHPNSKAIISFSFSYEQKIEL